MGRSIIVCTQHRGVYFGESDAEDDARTVVLTGCRCAIYWGTTGGVLQLASTGPTETSRIGSTARRVVLHDVIAIIDCTEAAAESFRTRPDPA